MPMKIQPPKRQRHQGMKGWTLRALARQLGRDKEAKLLREILDPDEQTDARLTELAGDGIDQKGERAPAGNGQGRRGRTARKGLGERKGQKASGRSASASGEETTRQELYERAKELDVEGRSRVSKEELARAVEQRT